MAGNATHYGLCSVVAPIPLGSAPQLRPCCPSKQRVFIKIDGAFKYRHGQHAQNSGDEQCNCYAWRMREQSVAQGC